MKVDDQNLLILSKTIDDQAVEVKIRSFSKLAKGWHFGEGGPIPKKVIDVALELCDFARSKNYSEFDAFPGVNGEILLTVYDANQVLELTIEPDLSINAVVEVSDVEMYDEEGLSIIDAKNLIPKLRENKWM